MLPLYVLAGVTGACIGSFLNVVIYRWPRRESVVRGRSHCTACGHRLSWHELVPLASYLLLRGRCRHCSRPIPVAYPLVEGVTAVLFVALVHVAGFTASALQLAVLGSLLVAAAGIDLRHRIVPNRLVGAGTACGLVLILLVEPSALGTRIAAAGASGLTLLAVHTGSRFAFGRTGLGMGDVKLGIMTALYFGWANFWVFYLAVVLGALLGLAGVWSGRMQRSTPLPFAPFVAAAAGLHVFFLPPDVLWPL